jgi:ferrous iron transport protein B
MLVYGSIFELAAFPMDFVDGLFADLSTWTSANLPEGKLTELLADGVIPGLGGVLMFVPQIAILFFLISILEETGYMSRVVFIMDRIMKPFGLSGKSVVPLVSGTACAIPAIMSARNIENPKERLITMLVTPFTTCSARIPVYIIIISLIIPKTYILGFVPLQAFVMTMMYVLGFLAALFSGLVLSKIIKADRKSFFVIEMPTYKAPILKNVFLNMYEKVISYVVGAGKIILALSVILWFLGSHGPSDTFGNAEEMVAEKQMNERLTEEQLASEIAGYQLEHSYIGIIGRTIEPVFRPLGYDWKISIAVLTSFAAREVFVGNLATLYNLGEEATEDETKIIDRMANEKRADGTPVYTFATGISLLLFYAFAMQCLSTVGVTKKQNQFAVQPPVSVLENIATLRIHLDETNSENGALKVIENSHSKGIFRPEIINWENEKEVTCKVNKGGVMLMKPLLLHSSGRTTNNKKRRVIHIELSNINLPKELNWAEKQEI